VVVAKSGSLSSTLQSLRVAEAVRSPSPEADRPLMPSACTSECWECHGKGVLVNPSLHAVFRASTSWLRGISKSIPLQM